MVIEMKGRPGEIRMYSGRNVQPLNLQPGDICIEDIAHSLANQCRFLGHTTRFYSVAEHSILMSRLVPAEHALTALLHDATEAYLGDLVRPLKHLPEMQFYRDAEERAWSLIARTFGLPEELPAAIVEADGRMLSTEMEEFLECNHDGGLPPYAVNQLDFDTQNVNQTQRFLKRFVELRDAQRKSVN